MSNVIRSNSGSRRGTVYVFVLGMLMLVMLSGGAAVVVARARTRTISQANDTIRAEALAESAVEYALTTLSQDPLWRMRYLSGVESARVALGGGSFTFKLVDEVDGNLNNNQYDPIRIYGIGIAGTATQVVSVAAGGTGALTCLNAAVMSAGNIDCGRASLALGTGVLASNTDVHGGTGSTVAAKVEAAGTVYPETWSLTGSVTGGVPQRGMPPSTVFDYYIANGTSIPYSSIPGGNIQRVVLSPLTNPYSLAFNPKGIYVIDCQNQRLIISGCRIVGTLVVLNPGAGSSLGAAGGGADQINWVPAVSNFPCLLVKGDISISFCPTAGSTLDELGNANFNPLGVAYPYPTGSSNLTATDSYPSAIGGLIYVSGNVTGSVSGTGTYPVLSNLVVGGTFSAGKDKYTVNYVSTYLSSPPPGFACSGTPVPTPGTWRRELSP